MFILETITIVGLLTLLFWGIMKPSLKNMANFIAIGSTICLIESYNFNDFIEAGLIVLAATFFWSLLLDTNRFWNMALKTLITNVICLMSMILIQVVWIPFYLYVCGVDIAYVQSHLFAFGLPCRAVEWIILLLIYIFKVKPVIGAKAVEGLGKAFSKNLASIWWVYTPKVPKCWRDK